MRITPNKILSPLLATALALSTLPAGAADSADCKSPKFSDVGWTDITATTAARLGRPARNRTRARNHRAVHPGHLRLHEKRRH